MATDGLKYCRVLGFRVIVLVTKVPFVNRPHATEHNLVANQFCRACIWPWEIFRGQGFHGQPSEWDLGEATPAGTLSQGTLARRNSMWTIFTCVCVSWSVSPCLATLRNDATQSTDCCSCSIQLCVTLGREFRAFPFVEINRPTHTI